MAFMTSSYFNPSSTTSLPAVLRAYGNPVGMVNVYAHIKRHQYAHSLQAPSKIVDGKLYVDKRMKPTFEVVEALPGSPTTNHELGLDDFIARGRAKLASGELTITATTFLQAIKVKMDNDAKTKDRRADMLTGLFKGAAPRRDV